MQAQHVVRGATLRGVEALPVDVEVLISSGLPSFSIVGMPDAAIQEARERIKAAIRACGFTMPGDKVVVNLAPGAVKKTGSGFDLPIAIGLLAASKQISGENLEKVLLVGELSLEGQVRPIPGLLAYAICAQRLGLDLICAQPKDGLIEMSGLEQWTVSSLSQFRNRNFEKAQMRACDAIQTTLDYSDIAGHDMAKRALQVVAAGGHGALLVGPPGSGKTMLTSRLPSILPPLPEKEKLETALIHSVVGLDISSILSGKRPFRKPHHSASLAGLIGGGNPPRPGEVSLAHNGVLFLDELSEYKPSTLQGIRQPIESGLIAITRAEGNVLFPAKFTLLAASNPCPCGYFGDKEISCSCSASQVKAYQNRIGGPLMDRIDIHINVWRTEPKIVLNTGTGTSSSHMRDQVMKAQEYKEYRVRHQGLSLQENSSTCIIASCELDSANKNFIEDMARFNHMSGRGVMRTLSIARTLADMDAKKRVCRGHLCEALNLRLHEGVGGTL